MAVGTAGYYHDKPHHDRYGMEIPHELCNCHVVIFGIRRKLNKELQNLRGKKHCTCYLSWLTREDLPINYMRLAPCGD